MSENIPANSADALGALVECFSDAVGQMHGPEFTSHQFILSLAQKHQRLYVEALHRYLDNDEPFKALHSLISRELTKSHYNLDRLADVDSEDIFRQPGRCAAWKKKA
jgi:hypothetical protein